MANIYRYAKLTCIDSVTNTHLLGSYSSPSSFRTRRRNHSSLIKALRRY